MDEQDIRYCEMEELERARSDAERALAVWNATSDPRLLLRTIYGLDNQPIGAFLNTGSLDTVLGSAEPCIVTLYPYPSEDDLKRAYGVTAKTLESLVAGKYVIPLVQNATRYSTLHYMHPILRHKPRNYFIRSVYFYAIFFDSAIELVPNGRLFMAPGLNSLYEKAKGNKTLCKILADSNSGVREFYDRLPFGSPADKETRIKENIFYRYASVAAFLGEEVTDYILETYPVQKALGVLLDLHFHFDHAWTQGLLADMHNEFKAHNIDSLDRWSPTNMWHGLSSRILCLDVPFPLLRDPRLDQLDVARSEGHQDLFDRSISDIGLRNLDELRATLRLRIAEIEARVDRIAERGQKTIKYRTITSVGLGLASAAMSGESMVGAGVGLATNMLLPEPILKGLSAAYQRLIRTHNVDAHLVRHLSNVWAARPLLPRRK